MTFAEKARKEIPDRCLEIGRPGGCPKDFGYEKHPPCLNCDISCDACWNREIPEEKLNGVKRRSGRYPWGSKQHQLQQLSESLWNKYVAFQEAGFDKAQAFDLTKVAYEAMLE